jgi:hypothetical protein
MVNNRAKDFPNTDTVKWTRYTTVLRPHVLSGAHRNSGSATYTGNRETDRDTRGGRGRNIQRIL